jgi:hypothetical protein
MEEIICEQNVKIQKEKRKRTNKKNRLDKYKFRGKIKVS